MRVLLVNSVCGSGSTGRICERLARELEAEGHEVRIAYGRASRIPPALRPKTLRIGTAADVLLHGLRTRLLDGQGFGSRRATKRFLRRAEDYDPELLWLHNLHGYYLNLELLFDWIRRRPQMEVRWTLHDCWAFTGHCVYFTQLGCDKWRGGCGACPGLRRYPASLLLDRSAENFRRKRAAFTGLERMTLFAPSAWLAGLVRQSFLRDYPVHVVRNEIDTAVFRPTEGDFRRRRGLEGTRLLLGVSAHWEERKGLDDFIRMAALLPEGWRIVLVGLSERQRRRMPAPILALGRVESAAALAEIYTAADVLVNPSYEDNYPTVDLEALACGTPVVSYDTGGSAEILPRENLVPPGDVNALLRRAMALAEERRRP